MLQARYGPTATLLKDGRVLVAGGAFADTLASAELYDPVTGAWSATGDMTVARYLHTATLLANGLVLVAGGSIDVIDPVAQPSAELYDPAIGIWTPTGSMIQARQGHTATLLPDGHVLVAGGTTGGGSSASAELYDPVTGSWAVTGSTAAGRIGHTATLLLGGTVLLAGGFDSYASGDGGVPNELYDPANGLWTPTGNMLVARAAPATLLLDGRVLVAGGAGRIPDSAYNTAELYDPATGSWTATPPMAQAHQSHTATGLPDGRVLVAGGGAGGGALRDVELYDPASGTWQNAGEMLDGRGGHTATLLLDGRVLIFGGCCDAGGGIMNSAELFDATP